MSKFRLKKEARQFFTDNLSKEVKDLPYWERQGIHENLLEPVEKVFVSYGIKKNECLTGCSGWSCDISHFDFTIYVQDIGYIEHDKIKVCELMDKIQKVINSYFTTPSV